MNKFAIERHCVYVNDIACNLEMGDQFIRQATGDRINTMLSKPYRELESEGGGLVNVFVEGDNRTLPVLDFINLESNERITLVRFSGYREEVHKQTKATTSDKVLQTA